MKLNRDKTIEMIKLRILELHIVNCQPLLHTYTNQQLVKVCSIYSIRPYYHE